jgi:hypothetical protein
MNTQIIVNTPVHVKAALNGEFRRFLLTPVTFENLETVVRTLFKLPSSILTIKFEDDEKDWVSLTTDAELLYAVELAGSPLRVNVQITGEQVISAPVPETVTKKCWKGKGQGKWNKKERLEAAQVRITTKIAALEEKVKSQTLTAEREKAINAQIARLQERLEFIAASKEATSTETPATVPAKVEEITPCEERGKRGKCCRGRKNENWVPRCRGLNSQLPPEILENFHQAKAAFKLAKETGNREEIQARKEAWFQAKQAKWAAKDQLRAQKFGEECK